MELVCMWEQVAAAAAGAYHTRGGMRTCPHLPLSSELRALQKNLQPLPQSVRLIVFTHEVDGGLPQLVLWIKTASLMCESIIHIMGNHHPVYFF